jgi:adenylate cyclase
LYGTTKSPQESLEKAIELAQKAIALDDGYPGGHAILGMLYCYKREYDKALAEGERAVALNPSGADVHAFYGLILTYACRPEEAIPMFQKAIRFNPFGPGWYYIPFSFALQNMGRLEEAVAACKKALQLSPDSISAHVGLASTYSMMGREKEARAEAAEVLRINPKFSLDYLSKVNPYKDPSVQENFVINPLRKAGLK